MQEDLLAFVQEAMVSCPNLARVESAPRFVVEAYATSDDSWARSLVASRKDLPDDIIDILLRDTVVLVLANLVRNNHVDVLKLRPLLHSKAERVRLLLAKRADLPRDMAMALWWNGNKEIRDVLLVHGDIDPNIIEDIVMNKSHADDRIKVAQRTNLPPELVAQLANDRVEAVRSMIASRTSNSTFR